MYKKRILLLSLLVLAAISASCFILFTGKPDMTKKEGQKNAITTESELKDGMTPSASGSSETNKEGSDGISYTEELEIQDNGYSLKGSLNERGTQTFLKFQYTIDGKEYEKEIDEVNLPLLKGIIEARSKEPGISGAHKMGKVFTDTVHEKIYFDITGNDDGEAVELSIYSYDLYKAELKVLFDGVSIYSTSWITPSPDWEYICFNRHKTEITESAPLLYIWRCSDNTSVVKGNKNRKGNFIGDDEVSNNFGYLLKKWISPSIIQLVRFNYDKNKGHEQGTEETLYDISKDTFVNPSGTPAPAKKAEENQKPLIKDSQSVQAIKNFYTLLAEENYDKANKLLDDDFKLNAFKLFGVPELAKKDIDPEKFKSYSSIFKAASLDSVVNEEITGDNATVWYYQKLTGDNGNSSTQALIAVLRKTDSGFKIVSVRDGKKNEKPFKGFNSEVKND